VIAGAPAEIALEALAYLLLRRTGVLLEEARRRHDHPGRAVPALEGVMLVKRLLDRMQGSVRREPLDRRDLSVLRLDGEHRAGLHGLAVDEDRAGAAGGGVAADVRAGQPEVLTQEVGEQPAGLHLGFAPHAVHRDRDTRFDRLPRRGRRLQR
jgi:hypothetical protein